MLWIAFHTIRVLRFKKSAIPCSLATRVNSHVNPKLMRNIRVWQWLWMNSKSKNLLEVTGRSLKKRMAMWEEENITRVFKSKFPVIYRTSSKMHFKFPGNFKPTLWNESIVSLWRKRHLESTTLTTAGAVFPPTGCLCLVWLLPSWWQRLDAKNPLFPVGTEGWFGCSTLRTCWATLCSLEPI